MNKAEDPQSQAAQQRERALAKHKMERDVFAAIIETAGALIVVLDLKGKIMSFNRACEDSSGYTAKEMKGKYIWNLLVPAEDIESTKAVITKLKAEGPPLKHENRWLACDGHLRHIAWTYNVTSQPPVCEDDVIAGEPVRVLP